MKAIVFIFSFAVVISTGTFLSIEFNDFVNLLFVSLALVVIFLSLINNNVRERNDYRMSIWIVFFMFVLLMSMLSAVIYHNSSDIVVNQLFFLCKIALFFSVTWLLGDQRKLIIEYISLIILNLSYVSLILLLLRYVFQSDFLPLFQVGDVKTSFLSTYYGTDLGLIGVVRNSSIFYEPGLYSVMLSFAFSYYFMKEKFSTKCKIIYISAISTLSPVGFILMNYLLMIEYWKKSYLLRTLVFLLGFLVIWFVTEFLYLKTESLSFAYRIEDIFISFRVFLDNIILGVGLFNDDVVRNYFQTRYDSMRASSNGLLILYYQLGVIGATLYFFFLLRALKFYFSRNYILSFVFLTSVMIFQPIQYSNFFILLFVLGHFTNHEKKHSFNCS
ncbi:hypothetical protein OTE47_001469 [Vibrio vulnificus]|nr:hypothetical protein [Vibrio vulnificus]EIZ1282037.1 hypothetical protein [Vibrio vulnificus]EKE1118227.1 hypothetical protein [Vibrio vulnificus]EME0137891.1 hypothetical protein [Vibrio vulnificus]HAS8106704.1 hypothetical protein [Vibrio vulnificus]